MSNADLLDPMDGIVLRVLCNGKALVEFPAGNTAVCHPAGRLRLHRIQLMVGDRVTVQLSPYHLTHGRITYRHRN
jgi:translation initiation factor IF-1